MAAGLKTIIALSFVRLYSPSSPSLSISFFRIPPAPSRHQPSTNNPQILAIGFLLVILSSALYKSYLTLLVVATYVLAPLPNWICGRCANPDDFMESAGSAIVDFGRFATGFLVVMGVGMSFPYLEVGAGF